MPALSYQIYACAICSAFSKIVMYHTAEVAQLMGALLPQRLAEG